MGIESNNGSHESKSFSITGALKQALGMLKGEYQPRIQEMTTVQSDRKTPGEIMQNMTVANAKAPADISGVGVMEGLEAGEFPPISLADAERMRRAHKAGAAAGHSNDRFDLLKEDQGADSHVKTRAS